MNKLKYEFFGFDGNLMKSGNWVMGLGELEWRRERLGLGLGFEINLLGVIN